ncbi:MULTISPECIES: hypothetical protein [Sorangium]|uniref:Secreted protein n=1 Tax=Sorangium cellulosum (strain So ce56) TaxID=448385 RepID=A9FYX6_SORC5|nr:hypothetical protein [Sorangium cellulosum]CAN98689.1 hypothetical protein predicted by Glimmer/Critica [Sorangium cellulosum So ce56]
MYKSIPLFIVGAVVSAALANSSDAAALHERVSGTNCAYGNGTSTGNLIAIGGAISNSSTSGAESVSCPVTDDDRFRKQDIATLNIHGYNGGISISGQSAEVDASTCVQYYGSTGGACTTPVSTSGNGNYTLSPPLTYWTSSNYADFGYIRIKLPPKGTNASTVRGYYTAD